jgi:hypothetical protein
MIRYSELFFRYLDTSEAVNKMVKETAACRGKLNAKSCIQYPLSVEASVSNCSWRGITNLRQLRKLSGWNYEASSEPASLRIGCSDPST